MMTCWKEGAISNRGFPCKGFQTRNMRLVVLFGRLSEKYDWNTEGG